VREGHIRLEGIVNWEYQRAAAENAVCYLSNVKGVSNDILLAER
jgi:osmotically-inducible protein OsmY